MCETGEFRTFMGGDYGSSPECRSLVESGKTMGQARSDGLSGLNGDGARSE